MTAEERLDQIQARADAATPGPWAPDDEDYAETGEAAVVQVEEGPGMVYIAQEMWQGPTEGHADAEFIAAARQDIPALVSALRAVLDLHQPVNLGRVELCCSGCEERAKANTCVEWPCLHVRAVEFALGDPS